MRPSSKLFLTILTAASALLMLAACNDRSPEKAEGAAAPAAASPAVTPTSPSSDTLTPANPPPGLSLIHI